MVPDESSKPSHGGKLIDEFLKSGKYVLINGTEKESGGPWTREDPSDPKKKSVLDLAIVSAELFEYVDSMIIDSNRTCTAFKRIGDQLRYSDHYGVIINFKGIPKRKVEPKSSSKHIIWNTNKPNGWQRFRELMDNNKKLEEVANNSIEDPDIIMDAIDRELKNVKFRAFGKVKINNKKGEALLDKLIKEKDRIMCRSDDEETKEKKLEEIDSKIVLQLKNVQRNKMEKEIENLQKIKKEKGNAAAIFKLKNKIIGKKSEPDAPSVMLDPVTKLPILEPAQIKQTCVDYVSNLLIDREPKAEFAEDIKLKKQIHEVCMKERLVHEPEYTEEMFNQTLKTLKRKAGNKYECILKGGKSLLKALNKLYRIVWEKEQIPKLWRETLVIQVPKGSKDKRDLTNIRHIHTKDPVSKVFSHMVTNLIKPIITKNISPFQIGAIPGHRADEHLFSIKSVVSMMEEKGEATAIQLLDLIKYFDSESLMDIQNELYKSEVRGRLYRLIYEMYKKSTIKVKTSVGTSEPKETKEIITQGSIEAGLVSSSNLASGVEDFFSSSEYELSYASLPLNPQSYQDDLLRACQSPESSQYGLDRFESLAKTKLLSYNLSKSSIVIMGPKKAREALVKEFNENPSKLYGEPLKVAKQESYLGDELGISVSESVTLTINKRLGLAKKAIFELKNVIEDCRSKIPGGIKTGLQIYEGCIIPFLLHNSSTWMEIKNSDMQRLVKLQNLFLGILLNIQKCPIPLMMWDLKVLKIPLRILKSKLLLYHHLCTLPEDSVAQKILFLQKSLNIKGFYNKVSSFLVENEIVDVSSFSKLEWKKFVGRKISLANRQSLIEDAKGYKKINALSLSVEEYKQKDYFSQLNLSQARMKFRERSLSLTVCKRHFSSERFSKGKYDLKSLFLCEFCDLEMVENLSHLRCCPGYKIYHFQRDLQVDSDLVAYFQDILQMRTAST